MIMRCPSFLSASIGLLYGGLLIASQAAPIALAADAPATQVEVSPANPVLLVLPFTAPAQGEGAWTGRAIQQDLVADLTQMTRARIIAPTTAGPAADEPTALDEARREGAVFAIFGQAQVSGGQMRVTGEVLDVTAGKPVGSLKATAPVNDLFPLEDSLAAQAVRTLPYPVGTAGAPKPPEPVAGQNASSYSSQPLAQTPQYSGVQSPPAEVAPSPYYSYTEVVPQTYYTYNPYDYYYPYWAYPWGPYWGGIYLGFGGGYFWHDHYWHGGPYYRGGFYGHPGYIGHGGYGFRGGGGGFRGGGGFHGGGGGRR
jgi:TolB-like protein